MLYPAELWVLEINGEGGIRTHGARLEHNSLAGSPIRPLSHLSKKPQSEIVQIPQIKKNKIGESGIRTHGRGHLQRFSRPPP